MTRSVGRLADDHRFETSWLLPPLPLAVLRGLFGLYILAQLVFVLAWECGHADAGGCAAARDEFSYFTVLNNWGLALYFVAAAARTAVYVGGGPLPLPPCLMPRRPLGALLLMEAADTLHALAYTTVTVFPFVVSAVYWGRLYAGHGYATPFDAWRNVSQHALNAAFALFEIAVPRTVPLLRLRRRPWWHLAQHALALLVLLALYLALAYVTRATKGFYVYSFLDPHAAGSSPGLVVAYVAGVAVGCLVVLALVQGLTWLRCWVTEEKLGCRGKFAFGGEDDDASSGHAIAGTEMVGTSKVPV